MKNLLRTILLVAPFIFAGTVLGQTSPTDGNQSYRILSKPRATYTDEARVKGVEGTVLLKVTLLASGSIGEITNVTVKNRKKLAKYGLVDKAIQAARQIQFTPRMVNGEPVTAVITFSYGFDIY